MKAYGARNGLMVEMRTMSRMGAIMGRYIKHVENLALTEDQIMKIIPVHDEMQKKEAKFKADLKIAQIELTESALKKPYQVRNNSAVTNIADIKEAHHVQLLKALKEMRIVLTDEQLRKMEKDYFNGEYKKIMCK